jgi:mannose-6-phosphate isomerase-like protein (cupin superfamily)
VNVRRVVTGVDGEGRSVVCSDDVERVGLTFPHLPGFEITRLWCTDRTPPDQVGEDLTLQPWELQPPDGGLNWQVIHRPPDESEATPTSQGAQLGTSEHRTDSLDLILIMAGEVWLYVGEAEVQLRAGDFVVQRGTDHRWRNRGTVPCTMLALMVSTHPGTGAIINASVD